MKYIKLLIFAFMLFAGTDALAQYMPYTGAGVDRRIDRQKYAPKTKNKKALEKKEMDISEVMADHLVKELKLDDFQKAAVKLIYDEHKDEILELSQDQDASSQVIKDKFRIISDKIDKRIIPLLSEEQAKAYQKIIEERNTKL